ncbi:MAG: hypothetical protein A2W25_16525 [candidate division Zixibacteria bacterium RBG_16_53_22]|nr:MAG: hypothetical protein A2W25_16525 [candidate division Zixibacteria bacterium RBG_16_53_22]
MINAKDIVVRYQSDGKVVEALGSVSLNIGEGEYVAMLGPNGSGKSTFLRALCGLVDIAGGEVTILGKTAAFGSFSDSLFGRVGVVFQEPEGQFVMRDAGTEIEMLLQNLGIPHDEQEGLFEQIVNEFELGPLLKRKPESLSGGQMQLVNLACALAGGARVLLLDEPTTFLDQTWREKFLSLLDKLSGDGLTILHITQYPDEAARARRICLLDRGQLAFDGQPDDIFSDENLLSRLRLTAPIRRQFAGVFGFDVSDIGKAADFANSLNREPAEPNQFCHVGEAVITVSEMSYSYRTSGFGIRVERLELYTSEIVGLVGPTGSGKSTLAFLLAGLLKPAQGIININGRRAEDCEAAKLRRPIGLSWQLADLALIGPTVEDDVRFGLEDKEVDTRNILELVGLEGFEGRIVDSLSGGEKRKLSLASILVAGPSLLILDEPSAFLDPGSQAELIGILRKIARQGHGIVIIGHDLHFISELADRVLGMKDGRIVIDVSSSEFFSSPDYLEMLGLPSNSIVDFRRMLVGRGITLSSGTLNVYEMARQLGLARAT